MKSNFSKLIVLGWLLSLFLIVGCTTTVEPTADTVDESVLPTVEPEPESEPASQLGDRIEVAAAGFSVQPPVGYLVDLDDPEGVQMHESEAAKESGPGIVVFGGEFGDEVSADEIYAFMIESDEMMQNVVRLPLDNPDADGFIAEFESDEAGILMKGKIILTLIDGQGTIVTAGGPAEAWDDDFSETVDAVAASIEMFPPEVE